MPERASQVRILSLPPKEKREMELTYRLKRLKHGPEGKPLERSRSRGQTVRHPPLKRTHVGSTPTGCTTMNRYTSTAGLVCVVRPPHRVCGSKLRGRNSVAECLSYKEEVVGSNPSARTIRSMPCAEVTPRQPEHAGVAQIGQSALLIRVRPQVQTLSPVLIRRSRRRRGCAATSSRRGRMDMAPAS